MLQNFFAKIRLNLSLSARFEPVGVKAAKTDYDEARKYLNLYPDANLGCLLAVIVSKKELLGTDNPRPKGIQQVGKDATLSPPDEDGILWLVVNDGILSGTEEDCKAYITNQQILDKVYGKDQVLVKDQEKE